MGVVVLVKYEQIRLRGKEEATPRVPTEAGAAEQGSHEITSPWLPPKGEALGKPHPAVCHHWKRHTEEHRDTLRSTGPHTDGDRHRDLGTHVDASPHDEAIYTH